MNSGGFSARHAGGGAGCLCIGYAVIPFVFTRKIAGLIADTAISSHSDTPECQKSAWVNLKMPKCLPLLARSELSKANINAEMDTTQHSGTMQRWFVIQHELMPEIRNEEGVLTSKQ